MTPDSEIRIELQHLHDQAVKVWAMLEERDKASMGAGFRMRRNLAKRAWKITHLTWPLERDVIREYDEP